MTDFLCIYKPPTGGTFRFHVNADVDNIYAEQSDYWDAATAAMNEYICARFTDHLVDFRGWVCLPDEFKAWVEGISFEPQ